MSGPRPPVSNQPSASRAPRLYGEPAAAPVASVASCRAMTIGSRNRAGRWMCRPEDRPRVSRSLSDIDGPLTPTRAAARDAMCCRPTSRWRGSGSGGDRPAGAWAWVRCEVTVRRGASARRAHSFNSSMSRVSVTRSASPTSASPSPTAAAHDVVPSSARRTRSRDVSSIVPATPSASRFSRSECGRAVTADTVAGGPEPGAFRLSFIGPIGPAPEPPGRGRRCSGSPGPCRRTGQGVELVLQRRRERTQLGYLLGVDRHGDGQ